MATNRLLGRDVVPHEAETATDDEIAIVGIGCRFPGGVVGPASFWQLLTGGVDAISEVPPDRWSARFFLDPNARNPGRLYARYGGFVGGIDQFDPQFFGLAPREAAFMDPQQRLLLEVCWEAFEDAGLVPESLSGSQAGVFVGISTHDFGDIQQKDIYTADFYANTGGALSIAANRISYLYNLCGPSLAVDTACSSSLVAVDLACRSLRAGTSDLAIAGGVNCILSPETTMSFSKGTMLSPDGRCKAFDARANGYVRGEGAGVVVLKRLDRALRDRDSIYAVIRASGVNQDGRTHGMTVPSREAQERLLRDLYQGANVPPDHVVYLEAHGTGTPVGDPIEAAAIGAALGRGRTNGADLPIGSVKSNIGHLEAGSGIAGLIKVAMVLKEQCIPPSLHFDEPNPRIPFEELRLRVPRAAEAFQVNGVPAVAGVNSFGFGGTNAHVVLQSAPRAAAGPRSAAAPQERLVPISARSAEALVAAAANLADYLTGSHLAPDARFDDVCYTAGIRRSHFEHRAAFVAASSEELALALRAFVAERAEAGSNGDRPELTGRIAFVFSGMGPQWAGMGRGLLCEPVFRRMAERCDHLFRDYAGWSILEQMLADQAQSRIREVDVAQPANFVLQMGLAELWTSWGVTPEAIVGHSAGEVAAAVAAGVLTLEDGVRVIFHRSRLQQRATHLGRMLAAALTPAEAEEAIAPYSESVAIAAINGPTSVTISGDSQALEAVARTLEGRGRYYRFLDVDVPYHSQYMDPLEGELREALRDLRGRVATVPFYSTVSGTPIEGPEMDAAYWWGNIRQPVLFAPVIDQLIADGFDRYVELAPHPVLAHSIRETLVARRAAGVAIPTLRRERERATALESLGVLYGHGLAVNWTALQADDAALVRLPTYPWQKTRCWHESEVSSRHRLADPPHPLLHRRLESPDLEWDTNVAAGLPSFLRDHVVHGSVVYPAAAYIEMALAAAQEIGCDAPVIDDLELKRALVLGTDAVMQVRVSVDAQHSGFTIHSRPRESGQTWTLHASGHLRLKRGGPAPPPERIDRLRHRCPAELSRPACYAAMRERGLQYGPMFQGVVALWQGRGEAVGRIECPETITAELSAYRFHPAMLDACFHVMMGAALLDGPGQSQRGTYLPVQMGRIRFHRSPAGSVWAHARVTHRNATHLIGDLSIIDASGEALMEISGFTCQRVPEALTTAAWTDHLFETQWFARSVPGADSRSPAGLPRPGILAESIPRPVATTARFKRRHHYEHVEPRIEALCGSYARAALAELGWQPRKGARVDLDALATRLGIVDSQRRLFARLLEMLTEDGFLKRTSTGWSVVRVSPTENIEPAWDELTRSHPEYEGVVRLVRGCGPHLAGVLSGRQEALPLVFPEGSMSLVENLYSESPYNHVYNHLVREVVSTVVRSLPAGRTIRILEIGAGTGSTTAHLMSALPRHRTEYVFTDVSPVFMAYGRDKLRDYPFVEYQLLDIERTPEEQGFAPGSFDIVLAADALHATKDLRECVQHVRHLLRPEGLLILLELMRPSRYLDLVFGLLKDWWRFEDDARRGGHPWLSRTGWRGLLGSNGFDDVVTVSDTRATGETFQAVVLARAADVSNPADLPLSRLRPEREAGQRWLIFADAGQVGSGVAALLQARGDDVTVIRAGEVFSLSGPGALMIRPDSAEEMRALLAWLSGDAFSVVHLWNLDAGDPAEAGPDALIGAERLGCVSLLHLVQAVATTGQGTPPRVWVVTRGAQQMPGETDVPHVAQSSVWGLGRVIANEHPPLRCTLVDLDPSPGGASTAAAALCRELTADDAEQEVGLRGTSRYVPRLVAAPTGLAPAADTPAPRKRRVPPFRLEPSRPGVLDGLILRETKRRRPGPGEVEIQVAASGLNFRDVMKAMGLYPTADGTDVWLGDECAGSIVRVGSGVDGFRPGDPVVAFSSGALRSFITQPVGHVRRRPAGLSMEQAATVPIVFLTVLYALKHLAHLGRGERILIHAAAGGVGLAAIQYAQSVGAEVFATAGSPEKREYLRSLGVSHIMDSRSQVFADEVMAITGGRGVSVVLNSLAGEFIPNSLSLLEPSGRFIELGKIDIYQDAPLSLGQFKNGRSFLAVDLGWLLVHRPDMASDLFSEVMELFAAGTFRPMPVTTFSIADASTAFRYMAQARHIGKIALTVADRIEATILPPSEEAPIASSRATYLVTGGLSGFGLAIAQWLVRQGARHLVLVGRRGAATPEAQEAVRRMTSLGVRVRVAAADVTEADAVRRLVEDIQHTMPPLRGIFHAAMVLEDAYLLQLDAAKLGRVMGPKVAGTWNLHAATLAIPLDYFVLFSSISSLTGAPGQGNYCAANAFLDGFVHYRRARNLAALTVNWGALADVGYVARNADIGRYLERQGLEGLGHLDAETILEGLLRSGRRHVAAIRADFGKLAAFAPSSQWSRRLSLLQSVRTNAEGGDRDERGALLTRLRAASAPERVELLQGALRKALASVLKIDADRIEPHQAISGLGLDSLMAVEFEARIKSEVSADVSIGFLAAGDSTLRQLTDRLLEQLVGGSAPAVAEPQLVAVAG
ncbi:MAG: SDR family NAD(P)-dependent oxidoreductase [Vicinamibacterales bacterium]